MGELIPQEYKKIEFKKNGQGSMPALRIECPVCHAPSGYACSYSRGAKGAPSNFHYQRTMAAPSPITKNDHIAKLGTLKVKKKKTVDKGRGVHEEGWISGNCTGSHHYGCYSLNCSCRCHKEKD